MNLSDFGGAPRHFMRTALTVCGLAAGLFTTDIALAQSQPKWGASINFEARPGTKRNLGEGDLFAPLAQTDTSLLFGNVRGRFDDDDNREGNFGLGFRHMFAGWNFGAYGYYDRKRTDFDNYFSQATFGVEALGRDFDFRANGYLPLGDRMKDAGSIAGGPTFASLSGSTIQVITPGALTRQEYAMAGFDAEIGWRVPIWAAEDTKALRLYAGIFHFDDSMVKAVTGPRLRAELTMYEVPYLWEGARLTLGAEFQHDDVRGSQGFGLVRLSIPLQPPAKDIKLTAQERRMTDRVVRDVDIVTQAKATQAPSIVETATETTGGTTLTVINSDVTSGAALPGAVSAAGVNSFIILSGTFNTTATTTLQTGQTLMGSGSVEVRTASGRTATWTTPGATVNMNVAGTALGFAMASDSTLSGMTINATGTDGAIGVRSSGTTGVTIANNTISASGTGNNVVAVELFGGAPTATISGNNLSATSTPGFYAIALFTNNGTYTIAGNTFNASGGNITRSLNLQNGPTINPGSTGNTLASGGCYNNLPVTGSIGLTGGATCP